MQSVFAPCGRSLGSVGAHVRDYVCCDLHKSAITFSAVRNVVSSAGERGFWGKEP